MEEKELILAHKDEQLNSMSTDKSKRSGEVNELKEIIDLKERKVAVLQKKVSHRFYDVFYVFFLVILFSFSFYQAGFFVTENLQKLQYIENAVSRAVKVIKFGQN